MSAKTVRVRMKFRLLDRVAISSLIPYGDSLRTTSANLLGGVSGFSLKKTKTRMHIKEKSAFCENTTSLKLYMH